MAAPGDNWASRPSPQSTGLEGFPFKLADSTSGTADSDQGKSGEQKKNHAERVQILSMDEDSEERDSCTGKRE
uniref:Uncharacterized protein n=1 Tax=Anguilla anguilla TaxID=7936 RepID=A0A0E9U6W2_ANGAN